MQQRIRIAVSGLYPGVCANWCTRSWLHLHVLFPSSRQHCELHTDVLLLCLGLDVQSRASWSWIFPTNDPTEILLITIKCRHATEEIRLAPRIRISNHIPQLEKISFFLNKFPQGKLETGKIKDNISVRWIDVGYRGQTVALNSRIGVKKTQRARLQGLSTALVTIGLFPQHPV